MPLVELWTGFETQRFKGFPVFNTPNSDFGSFLDQLNTERIARMIRGFAPTKPFRFALIGALNRCEVTSLIPDAINKSFKTSF